MAQVLRDVFVADIPVKYPFFPGIFLSFPAFLSTWRWPFPRTTMTWGGGTRKGRKTPGKKGYLTDMVAGNRQALTMEVTCQRMTESYQDLLMPGEMEKRLHLFSKLLLDWVSILPIRTKTYIKLDKSLDLNIITEHLITQTKKEEKL